MTKVLVAEDNPVNRELLRELLENRGYVVVEACDGQQALRMVDEICSRAQDPGESRISPIANIGHYSLCNAGRP